jgi:hypothetical protein
MSSACAFIAQAVVSARAVAPAAPRAARATARPRTRRVVTRAAPDAPPQEASTGACFLISTIRFTRPLKMRRFLPERRARRETRVSCDPALRHDDNSTLGDVPFRGGDGRRTFPQEISDRNETRHRTTSGLLFFTLRKPDRQASLFRKPPALPDADAHAAIPRGTTRP